jgi:hypothetical protein
MPVQSDGYRVWKKTYLGRSDPADTSSIRGMSGKWGTVIHFGPDLDKEAGLSPGASKFGVFHRWSSILIEYILVECVSAKGRGKYASVKVGVETVMLIGTIAIINA